MLVILDASLALIVISYLASIVDYLTLLHYPSLYFYLESVAWNDRNHGRAVRLHTHHNSIMDDHQSLFPRKNGEADFDFYPYNPSNVAGYIFVALFAVGSVVHLGYIIPYRTWYCIPFLLGCIGKSTTPNPNPNIEPQILTTLLAETGGYYGRAWAHDNRRAGSPYLIQLFLLIVAVPFLSASVYMTLSRMTRALEATNLSIVRISWISKIYILIDIACVVLQVMGTVTMAYGGADEQQKAINLVAGGLAFQLVAFVVFVLLAMRIHWRLNQEPTNVSSRIRWRRYFWMLYVVSGLVLLRNLVRIVEFVQGIDGAVASHEAYLYIFDAVPMGLVVVLYTVLYPGQLMRSARRMDKGTADAVRLMDHV
jgi:hypothetical protein